MIKRRVSVDVIRVTTEVPSTIISPVIGSFITAAVRPTPVLPLPVKRGVIQNHQSDHCILMFPRYVVDHFVFDFREKM